MNKVISGFVVFALGIAALTFFYYLNDSYQIKIIPETKAEIKEVVLKEEDKTYKVELEKYIIGVVACEMNASFDPEALKAQAIASRTFAAYKMENTNKDYHLLTTTTDQCYIDEAGMREKWNTQYDKYYNIVKNAVEKTSGIVMHKDNKLFKSFYFSTSNGNTQDSIAVFQEGNITSVSSLWDKDSKQYKVETLFSKEELEKILGNFQNIQIKERDNNHYVTKVSVDDKEYSGIDFRKLLQLRSADFEIDVQDNDYKIITYGYGHGVGMSQYGANYLALQGHDYKYILNYYYNDVEFVNY